MSDILIPVSPGELLDKITILQLKAERIDDPDRLANVRHELALLEAARDAHMTDDPVLAELTEALFAINAALWTIEDDIRACDGAGDFGARFIGLAQAVYRTNDRRAAVKKRINLHLGSTIVEEKSYHDHGPPGGLPHDP